MQESTGLQTYMENNDALWWLRADDDGVCKTVSNTQEINEQGCDSATDAKPLCQLGILNKHLNIVRIFLYYNRFEM